MSFQAIGTGSGILGFRPCWCPSPFPSPSISRCFPFILLHLPLDFIRLFLTVTVSAPRHQPSSFTWAWDQHRVTADPEAELYTITTVLYLRKVILKCNVITIINCHSKATIKKSHKLYWLITN